MSLISLENIECRRELYVELESVCKLCVTKVGVVGCVKCLIPFC